MNPFKRYRHSFHFKVMIVSVLFMLLTCISLTLYYVRIQYTSRSAALADRAHLLASTLTHSAKLGIFSENSHLLKDPVLGVAEQNEVIHVAIFNASGKLLLKKQSTPATHPVSSAPAVEKIEEKLLTRLWQSIVPIYVSNQNSLNVWSTVFSTTGYGSEGSLFFNDNRRKKRDNIIGFTNIVLSKERLHREIFSFIYKAIIIALVAIVAGSVVILYFIRSITTPLRQLTQGIKNLGKEGQAKEILVNSEDEIGKLSMAFNDLSESLNKKKAENHSLEMQLRQIQKLEALGTLAGGIAHDFNNVLSPIIGFTEMAMEGLSKKDLVSKDLQEVLNAAIRAKELVKQILAFSRQTESKRIPLKVQLIIKEALSLLRATMPTTIKFSHHINNDCMPMMADPVDIHRIIINLCTNAFHAMPERKGILKVTLDDCLINHTEPIPAWNLSPGRYLKLTVSDTGTGMDGATKQKIFDPYFTTKSPDKGTGMGLSVVHGIVKSYKGNIQVESEPDQGSIFKIYLPAIEEDNAPSDDLNIGEIQGGHEHILLVDDELQIVQMLKQMLDQLGYQVTSCTSSIEARHLFKNQPDEFDLVITDLTMPNMTGYELALKLMKIRRDIPIIICTGFSEKISDEMVRENGIRALLMKPVIKRKMAATIRGVMDGSDNETDHGS